jgi:hypothetical protein
LKKLDCDDCQNLTDKAISELQNFIHLEELNLSSTEVTGENFHLLPTSLKKLECYSCKKLIDEAIEYLQKFKNL